MNTLAEFESCPIEMLDSIAWCQRDAFALTESADGHQRCPGCDPRFESIAYCWHDGTRMVRDAATRRRSCIWHSPPPPEDTITKRRARR